MFGALGRTREDGQVKGEDRDKVRDILILLGFKPVETFIVPIKRTEGKGGNKLDQIEVKCIKLNDAPIVLTQFKPTARAGEEALKLWVNFMKFVNNLLVSNNVNLFDIQDKKNQLSAQTRLDNEGGKVVVMNNLLSQMLAQLIGVDGKILKSDIRKFQEENPQIRLDLGLVYEELREDFVNAYEFTQSHSIAREMTLKKAKRKYDI